MHTTDYPSSFCFFKAFHVRLITLANTLQIKPQLEHISNRLTIILWRTIQAGSSKTHFEPSDHNPREFSAYAWLLSTSKTTVVIILFFFLILFIYFYLFDLRSIHMILWSFLFSLWIRYIIPKHHVYFVIDFFWDMRSTSLWLSYLSWCTITNPVHIKLIPKCGIISPIAHHLLLCSIP